jgi:hypothetical protein
VCQVRRGHEADQQRLQELVDARSAARKHVQAGNVLFPSSVDTPAVSEVLNLSIQDQHLVLIICQVDGQSRSAASHSMFSGTSNNAPHDSTTVVCLPIHCTRLYLMCIRGM